jgi:outer membrane protein assembly factor BamE
MRTLFRTLVCALLVCAVAGCGIVYKPTVQQGNLLDKKNVEKLKPGMTKRQVIVLMGSPSVASPFDQDRWDYVATLSQRGGKMTTRSFSLFFDNDVLVRTEGDWFAADEQKLLKESRKYRVSYPVNETEGDKSPSGSDDDDKDGGDSSGDDSGVP